MVNMGAGSSTINFGAGPAKLPRKVLEDVQKELLSFQDSGMSIMEMSHRSKEYTKINKDSQSAIRDLLRVPHNYKILLMQGGGLGGFAAVAMNLMSRTGTADYVVTGTWSASAAKEAEKYGKVNLVFPKAKKPGSIPDQSTWTLNSNASYLYYCDNETVDGVEFPYVPNNPHNVPIVADMSSSIMTKTLDVSKFGVIFGGAQKNIGPAGVVFVIIREDLLGSPMKICPSILDFTHIAKNNSVHNTPATLSVYIMEKVLQWIKKNGGVEGMQKESLEKSEKLYKAIADSGKFYCSPIDENVRSRINIPFRVGGPNGNEELETKFLEEAEKVKMQQLKGHRTVGGIRASLYNAVTLDDVTALVEFMEEFKKRVTNAQYTRNDSIQNEEDTTALKPRKRSKAEESNMGSVMNLLKQMNNKLEKVDNSLQFNSEQLLKTQNTMKGIKSENEKLKSDNDHLKVKITELAKEMSQMQDSINRYKK